MAEVISAKLELVREARFIPRIYCIEHGCDDVNGEGLVFRQGAKDPW